MSACWRPIPRTPARPARSCPLYEEDEKWARLPALYEVLLAHSSDEGEKLALLEKLVEVTGRRLSDRKAAVGYARQAYELAPGNAQALELLEGSARAAELGAFRRGGRGAAGQRPDRRPPKPRSPKAAGRRRSARRKQAPAAPGGVSAGERRDLALKLARVYAEELGRTDEAVATYKRLLERDPTDDQTAQALEVILRREDRRDELRWLLDLRVEHTASDAERSQILSDWATLEEEVFGSGERAAELYRRMLEIEPANSIALGALPRLLLAAGDAAGAAEVIEQHRDQLGGAEAAALRRGAGGALSRPPRAPDGCALGVRCARWRSARARRGP